MNLENNPLYGISTIEELSKVFSMSIEKLKEGTEKTYRTITIRQEKNNKIKKRRIDIPPCEKSEGLFKLAKCFQLIDYPEYVMAGWECQNNLLNAEAHVGAKEVITLDVTHFFSNSKKKYVEKFLKERLKISGEALEYMLKYVTHNGYLPTGSPTSSILAYLSHKDLFDSIYKTMSKNNIKMTLYIDDITLSSQGHIGNWTIKYIKNTLKQHGLYLKKAKIKHFGCKGSKITGKFISQNGKITAPWHFSKEVKEMLKSKPIKEMTEKELQSLLSKIGIIRQTEPKMFIAQHNIAKKQIRRLHKQNKPEITSEKERRTKWNNWTPTLLSKIHIVGTWSKQLPTQTNNLPINTQICQ